jgi:hypothetical protein
MFTKWVRKEKAGGDLSGVVPLASSRQYLIVGQWGIISIMW